MVSGLMDITYVVYSVSMFDELMNCINPVYSDAMVLCRLKLLYFFFTTELLSDGSVSSRLQDTKAASEVRALDSFYQMLSHDPNRAVYGYVKNTIYLC